MPELATIAQGVQIGPEVTPGTGVAASKLLNYLSIALNPAITFNRQRPMGQKVASAIVPTQDSSTLTLASEVGSYSELAYVFCSLLQNVTPTTVDTSAKLWTFNPAARTEDTVKTFTVEQGTAVRAQKVAYGLINEMEITFSRTEGITLSGAGFAQQIQDNITMTATPTAVEDAPILPTHLDVFIDNTSAGLGVTKLTRDFTAVWRCTGRFGQVWPINSTLLSYASHVETEPTVQMEMQLEADTQGMQFLADVRAGNTTKFIRLSAVSTVNAGAATAKYQLLIDMAGKVSDISEFDDVDGVKCIGFTYDAIYDATWGKFLTIGLQNKTATL